MPTKTSDTPAVKLKVTNPNTIAMLEDQLKRKRAAIDEINQKHITGTQDKRSVLHDKHGVKAALYKTGLMDRDALVIMASDDAIYRNECLVARPLGYEEPFETPMVDMEPAIPKQLRFSKDGNDWYVTVSFYESGAKLPKRPTW